MPPWTDVPYIRMGALTNPVVDFDVNGPPYSTYIDLEEGLPSRVLCPRGRITGWVHTPGQEWQDGRHSQPRQILGNNRELSQYYDFSGSAGWALGADDKLVYNWINTDGSKVRA